MHAVGLRCEHREGIPCVDDPAPRFNWALKHGQRQTAYRLLVAEGVDDLAAERGTLWDSGRVASAETIGVPYAGRPLAPLGEFVWSVQVWDEAGSASAWSEPARFRTGPATWVASWIARDPVHDPAVPVPGTETDLDETDVMMRRLRPCPYFRRAVHVTRETRRATLYATARGVLELELNGTRMGDAVLAPGWTDYRHRIEYDAYDVTELLRSGENVLGAIVGDGWYGGFQTPTMNSFNHYSLGSVGQWLYEYVAGIRAATPGYGHVIIAPEPGELEWARAEYRSVRGPIISAWRQDGDTFQLEVELPANVTATVLVPGAEAVDDGPGRHTFTSAREPA